MSTDRQRPPRTLVISLVVLVLLGIAALWAVAPESSDRATPGPGVATTDQPGIDEATTTTTESVTPPCTLPPAPSPTTTTSRSTTTTTSTLPPAPPPAPPPPPLPDETLTVGDAGEAVLALQLRLASLGYWLPGTDGTFGYETAHAVTAFQKVVGLPRDGVAGPATWAALAGATRPQAGVPGRAVEVDLRRQVVFVVRGGSVEAVLDASTGSVPGTTPIGTFTVFRQVDGYDHGPLGTLYRPKYFSGGVAIHGFLSVPPAPASHGCVRVTNAAMDWIWATSAADIGTTVVVHP